MISLFFIINFYYFYDIIPHIFIANTLFIEPCFFQVLKGSPINIRSPYMHGNEIDHIHKLTNCGLIASHVFQHNYFPAIFTHSAYFFQPFTGSGTEQKTQEVATVSNALSSKDIFSAFISINVMFSLCSLLYLAFESIFSLKSIPVTSLSDE